VELLPPVAIDGVVTPLAELVAVVVVTAGFVDDKPGVVITAAAWGCLVRLPAVVAVVVPGKVPAVTFVVVVVPVLDVVILLVDDVELGFDVDNGNAIVLGVVLSLVVTGGVVGEPPAGTSCEVPAAILSQYSRLRRPRFGRGVLLGRVTLGVLWSIGIWSVAADRAIARRRRVSIIP